MENKNEKINEKIKEGITVFDVKPEMFISSLAVKLKQMPEFAMPEWAKFVKTSSGNERPPHDKDWWYKRAASLLRQIYVNGVIGVNRLSTKYGTKKDRGSKPEKVVRASRKILRTMLQQSEKAGVTHKEKKGRSFTKQGLELFSDIIHDIKNQK